MMKKAFRKYHRILAIIIAWPLTLTVLTGMLTTVVKEWPINTEISARLLVKIHTGEIFNLQAIYPILKGASQFGRNTR